MMKKSGHTAKGSAISSRLEHPAPASFVYANDPDTLALLLKTSEVKCVIQALDVLYDMILENRKVGENLLKKGILDDIYNLPRNSYPYYNGARYRFLSKMYLLFPKTRRRMERATFMVHMAVEDALKTDDTPLLAYSLQYASLMTMNQHQLLKTLTEMYDFSKIFTDFLTDPDVDVQNNALHLTRNLLRNPQTARTVLDLTGFRMEPLCSQVACPYPDIQEKALDVLDCLTSWPGNRRQWLQDMFNSAAGIHLLLTILFVFQWRDVHGKCLKVLLNLTDSTPNLINLDSAQAITKLVQYLDFIELEDLKVKCMEVLLRISRFDEGRLVLITNEAIPAFFSLLEKGEEDTAMRASEGLRAVSQDSASIPYLSACNPVPVLVGILLDSNNSSELRCNAATTLNAIVKVVPACALTFSAQDNFERMVTVQKESSLDAECRTQILEAMSAVLSFPTRLTPLISQTFSQVLLDILYESHAVKPSLTIYAAEILSWCMQREAGREIFIKQGAVNEVMKILHRSRNEEVLNAIGLLLIVAFEEQLVVDSFIRAGIGSWLRLNRDLCKTCPNLTAASDSLFSSQLPLKLEYHGRLDVWDETRDGFYVCRCLEPNGEFPLLTDLFQRSDRQSSSANCVVYYLSMHLPSTSPLPPKDELSISSIDEEKSPKYSLNELAPQDSFQRILIDAKMSRQTVLPVDKRLLEIYKDVEMQLRNTTGSKSAGAERFQKGWIEERVEVIAKNVAEAMSGHKYGDKCTDHTFALHLIETKEKLKSQIIPIGALEIGLKLERAILFKVLADRVQLPCALVRGDYISGWVEVGLTGTSEDCNYRELPLRQVVTTHLVDLMNRPGELLPLESEAAAEYCGRPRDSSVGSGAPQRLQVGRPQLARTRQHFHIEIE